MGGIRPVRLTVQPPIVLGELQLLSSSSLSMTLHGTSNRIYSIEVSSNLLTLPPTNWIEVYRFTNTMGQTRFTNEVPFPPQQRFFRAKELP